MDTATAPAPVRGIELRLLRLERRVTASAVGRAAGWSRQRVGAIEASDLPTRRAAGRYMQALQAAALDR